MAFYSAEIALVFILLNTLVIANETNNKKEKTKNVLLIFADDAGRETSIYNNSVCKTPNLQRLADRSVIFDEAFTSVSSCSPSRAALLTGLPSHQNGMYGLHNSVHHFNSFDAVMSLPNVLKAGGIRTGIIGKKHIGPEAVFSFDFAFTEDNHSINQVGRNITLIKHLVRLFLSQNDSRPFFLYVAFHDPHRCGHTNPEFGNFCQKFGNGEPGMGIIADWNPVYYPLDAIDVPYFLPDSTEIRRDLSDQYTTISRLDQGIGLIINELESMDLLNNTLIIYTSDNGPPFPMGRTNLYDPGIKEPLLISNPSKPELWAKRVSSQVSLLDIMPTVLQWFDLSLPNYKLFSKKVLFTGKSLLSFTEKVMNIEEKRPVFGSHTWHEITMFYPMRSIRTDRFKLIHNLNHNSPFGIDQDLYVSPSFQYVMNRSHHWIKNLTQYYFRPEWELFDLISDPKETKNVYNSMKRNKTVKNLKKRLLKWRNVTNDPFICYPHSVLEDTGDYKTRPQCLPLFNRKETVSPLIH